MMRYKVITGYPAEVEKQVNEALVAGWLVHQAIPIDNGREFSQILVHPESLAQGRLPAPETPQ